MICIIYKYYTLIFQWFFRLKPKLTTATEVEHGAEVGKSCNGVMVMKYFLLKSLTKWLLIFD